MSKSDISNMIQMKVKREWPGSREFEAELRIAANGQVSTEQHIDDYSHEYNRMVKQLHTIILNTVHQETIRRLEALIVEYINKSKTSVYLEYKAYSAIIYDLQNTIKELRGL